MAEIAEQILATANSWSTLWSFLLIAIVYDQYRYISKKGSIAGSRFKVPFIGDFFQSFDQEFHKYKSTWESGALSCSSIFHKFVVIASDPDITRKIFNSPAFVKPCVAETAVHLLKPQNWVFLDGKSHTDYRKGLNELFTRRALDTYLPNMQDVHSKYLESIASLTEQHGAVPFMPIFREMMCAVSCRTYVGTYISEEAVKTIAKDYWKITAALDLVGLPFLIPYTRPWYGKKIADMVLEEFSKCAARAKKRMLAGGEPNCIMDQWITNMIASENYRKKLEKRDVTREERPDNIIRWFSDMEISMTIFTLLFASQDAMSSFCTWVFQLVGDRQELQKQIHQEALHVCGGESDKELTLEMVEKMTFTRAVVKETLRYRPPVLIIPYIAKKDFPLTDYYTLPKGAMVCPSTYPSLRDPVAYPNPDTFDPERWLTGNAEAHKSNWLVFGTGPHHCIGQNFAILNIMTLLAKASIKVKWSHDVTPESEKIKIFATIFPKDDCFLKFKRRE